MSLYRHFADIEDQDASTQTIRLARNSSKDQQLSACKRRSPSPVGRAEARPISRRVMVPVDPTTNSDTPARR
jgi:hypothetical protein